MEEIWKDIEGYNGLYQISNFGNVKSFMKSSIYRNNNKGIILRKTFNSSGYLMVNLYKNKRHKSSPVHQLVAITFLGHIPDGTHSIVINHIDGNRLNNMFSNLELCTHRYNISDGLLRKDTYSKFTGVSWSKKSKKWISQIRINKKLMYLGLFKSELEASDAYQNKLKEINE